MVKILNEEQKNINALITKEYGYDSRSRQTIEECAELTQILNKFHRYNLNSGKISFKDAMNYINDNIDNKDDGNIGRYYDVVTEIADALICIDAMIKSFDCEEEIEEIINYKLNREITRMEKRKEGNIHG